ncbi:hypothetical protein BDZ89DRAFT_1040870 [Hymenopellis radicata]|nr:hypothetical protein BDZ89DRAFT_1040870 [Hymenopellis radicata]
MSDHQLPGILMRSQTPGPNEKVLDYLEGMSRDEIDTKPPPSLVDNAEYRSRGSRSRGPSRVQSPAARSHRSDAPNDRANSRVSYNGRDDNAGDGGNDFDSNAQERSDNGEEEILHVPGPQDPPGPRYESYDSGPSFGNLGPMPEDYGANPVSVLSALDPQWGNHKPNVPWDINTKKPNESMLGGQPASPNNTPPTISESRAHQAKARDSLQASTSTKTNSQANTYRPMSPESAESRRTRATTEKAYNYPLPESRIGEHDMPLSPVSPTRSRAPSKAPSMAPSVSPSDSLSNYHSRPKNRSKTTATPPVEESSPRSDGRSLAQNGKGRVNGSAASHQSRPFSPYRHAPTTDDLLHAVVRDRAVPPPIQEETSKDLSKAPSTVQPSNRSVQAPPSHVSKSPSKVSKSPSKAPTSPSVASSRREKKRDADATPTPSRPNTPGEAKIDEEEEIVRQVLASAGHTPRTSKTYSGSALGSDIVDSHYHDNELCVLFQFLNVDSSPELVKKVLRKAIRRRVKDLGMRYDNESIKEIQKSHLHGTGPGTEIEDVEEPPKWASDLKREIVLMQQRIESLGPKIENLRPPPSFPQETDRFIEGEDDDDYTHTPVTQTVNIHTQPTGTMAESAYQPETEIVVDEDEDEEGHGHVPEGTYQEVTERGPARRFPHLDGEDYDRDDSPGQQYLEEELYKLRQKPARRRQSTSTAPTIPGTDAGFDPDNAPAPPESAGSVVTTPQPNYGDETFDSSDGLLPWQRIHQRLLGWAIVWPMSEFDEALSSTMRGSQVNEVAMSIWSTQTYKRYVRSRLTDNPKQPVDRLFVPPNMADAINNAVFHGRHGDACGMLRDLWAPFGLPGMPRLLVVLAKHRSDENHWVVHRFSLPEGLLTTYDSYPEKTLPDGRPLGWWFAIRLAWPTALYPNPDHLIQKMVRLHRPMQRSVDNSLAAGGIWRNVLMGSRPERSLDLERLRDLINTEVKNLRTRKQVGKLSISARQPGWDMN